MITTPQLQITLAAATTSFVESVRALGPLLARMGETMARAICTWPHRGRLYRERPVDRARRLHVERALRLRARRATRRHLRLIRLGYR